MSLNTLPIKYIEYLPIVYTKNTNIVNRLFLSLNYNRDNILDTILKQNKDIPTEYIHQVCKLNLQLIELRARNISLSYKNISFLHDYTITYDIVDPAIYNINLLDNPILEFKINYSYSKFQLNFNLNQLMIHLYPTDVLIELQNFLGKVWFEIFKQYITKKSLTISNILIGNVKLQTLLQESYLSIYPIFFQIFNITEEKILYYRNLLTYKNNIFYYYYRYLYNQIFLPIKNSYNYFTTSYDLLHINTIIKQNLSINIINNISYKNFNILNYINKFEYLIKYDIDEFNLDTFNNLSSNLTDDIFLDVTLGNVLIWLDYTIINKLDQLLFFFKKFLSTNFISNFYLLPYFNKILYSYIILINKFKILTIDLIIIDYILIIDLFDLLQYNLLLNKYLCKILYFFNILKLYNFFKEDIKNLNICSNYELYIIPYAFYVIKNRQLLNSLDNSIIYFKNYLSNDFINNCEHLLLNDYLEYDETIYNCQFSDEYLD